MIKNIFFLLTFISSVHINSYAADTIDKDLEPVRINKSYGERFFSGDLSAADLEKIQSLEVVNYVFSNLYQNGKPLNIEFTHIMEQLNKIEGISLTKKRDTISNKSSRKFDYIVDYNIKNENIVQKYLENYYNLSTREMLRSDK